MIDVIWKYPLAHSCINTINLPAGAEVVHVGMQQGVITLWIRRSPEEANLSTHKFSVVGTGREFDAKLEFIGTVMDGPYVWHVVRDNS